MDSDGNSPAVGPHRSTRVEACETIELAVIAWVCCLAVVMAIAIPLLGLARAALVAGGSLIGIVAVCFAVSGLHFSRGRLS